MASSIKGPSASAGAPSPTLPKIPGGKELMAQLPSDPVELDDLAKEGAKIANCNDWVYSPGPGFQCGEDGKWFLT